MRAKYSRWCAVLTLALVAVIVFMSSGFDGRSRATTRRYKPCEATWIALVSLFLSALRSWSLRLREKSSTHPRRHIIAQRIVIGLPGSDPTTGDR